VWWKSCGRKQSSRHHFSFDPDPAGAGRARWTMLWKPALNAFSITFGDRWAAAETY
jgi:hypothetical protein